MVPNLVTWLAAVAEGLALVLVDDGYLLFVVILRVKLFFVQLVAAWLARADSLPFILPCFLALALGTRFLAEGKLVLQRWWLCLQNLVAVPRGLQFLALSLCDLS
jgi:hypothetical protein